MWERENWRRNNVETEISSKFGRFFSKNFIDLDQDFEVFRPPLRHRIDVTSTNHFITGSCKNNRTGVPYIFLFQEYLFVDCMRFFLSVSVLRTKIVLSSWLSRWKKKCFLPFQCTKKRAIDGQRRALPFHKRIVSCIFLRRFPIWQAQGPIC